MSKRDDTYIYLGGGGNFEFWRNGQREWTTETAVEALDKMCAEIQELDRQLADAYRFISDHDTAAVNHACEQCVPNGDIVIEGFVCVPHRVCAYLDEKETDQ